MIENTVTPEEHAKMAKEVIDRMESKEGTKVFTKAHSDELNAMLAADKAKGKGKGKKNSAPAAEAEPKAEPKTEPEEEPTGKPKPEREFVNVGAATAPIPEPQSNPEMDSDTRSEVFHQATKAHKAPARAGREILFGKPLGPNATVFDHIRNDQGYNHTEEDLTDLQHKNQLNDFYGHLDKDHARGDHEESSLGNHPHCSACIVKAAIS
jgi:hypothetical protein